MVTSDLSNPFCTRFVRPGSIGYQFDTREASVAGRQQIVGQIQSLRYTSVVGPHGSGKSTLLESLKPQLKEIFVRIHHVTLHAQPRPLTFLSRYRYQREALGTVLDAANCDLLIIDGFEQLSWVAQKRFRARTKQTKLHTLITCHAPITGFAILHHANVTVEKAKRLTVHLIEHLPTQTRRQIETKLEHLLVEYQTSAREINLREVWFKLYDSIQIDRQGC